MKVPPPARSFSPTVASAGAVAGGAAPVDVWAPSGPPEWTPPAPPRLVACKPSSEEAERIAAAATAIGWGGRGHGFLWMDSHKNDAAFEQFQHQLQQSDPESPVARLQAQSPEELIRLTQDLTRGRRATASEVLWLDTRPQAPDESRAWKEAWLTSYNCLNGLDHQSLPVRFIVMAVPPEVSGPELNHAAVDFWSKRNTF